MPPPCRLPSLDESRQLHQRLLDHQPSAKLLLAEAYLDPLIDWLATFYPNTDEHFRREAAGSALLALMENPGGYNPSLKGLGEYLQMSARGDLLNLLKKEKRHVSGQISLESVELRPDAGKYLGYEDKPTMADEPAPEAEILSRVRQGLTEPEQRCLELMLEGKRSTALFAAVLSLQELSQTEQKLAVKRVKDRLKKRLEREGSGE